MTFAATIDDTPIPLEPARVTRWLLTSVVALTATLLLWAGLAQVDETAVAAGRVVPSAQLQVVSNLEGGVVAEILVRPGTLVAAGEPLVRLDHTQFGADFGRNSAARDALAARAARLEAEVAGRAPAPAAGPLAATETALYHARRAELSAATAAESARLTQAERALGEAHVEAAARTAAARVAAEEAAMVATLVDKGIEPRVALIRAEGERSVARSAAESAVLAVARARAAVAEARSGVAAAAGRFRAQAVEQLTQTRAELAAQGASLPAAADRLDRTTVRAPVAGTVGRVLVATVGGSVRPGEPLVEIVPAGGGLVVEASVRPSDIAFIRPGQRATVKLTAYDYAVYGALKGTGDRIAPDTVVDPRTGEALYSVRVRTDGALHGRDGQALPVGAGMVAEVDMLGEKRSVMNYLLSPVTRLSNSAFRER